MIDLNKIRDIPLPIFFLLIGSIMASVGFGLEITVAINVANMNKTFAKIIGITFLILGIIPYIYSFFPKEQRPLFRLSDHFLVYYLICIPIVTVLCWVVLMFTTGEIQIRATKYIFLLTGFLVTIVVIWRIMDDFAYIRYPQQQIIPQGLYERSSYMPYVILIGIALVIFIYIISIYTEKPSNLDNKLPIYSNFAKFCVYLITCRLVWEIADYIARFKIPKPNNN